MKDEKQLPQGSKYEPLYAIGGIMIFLAVVCALAGVGTWLFNVPFAEAFMYTCIGFALVFMGMLF